MDLSSLVPVILTIHVLIVLALIGVVLLQRSEGGALGIGGGGGGGFMSGRGAANVLTRSTSILAALFFANSLGLAIVADHGETEAEIIEDFTGVDPEELSEDPFDSESLIRSIGGSLGTETAADAPATPADTPDEPAAPGQDAEAPDPAADAPAPNADAPAQDETKPPTP
ncbi:MAG: preprotein translocase subunit SecG [Pseudomonadota bacterium]